MNRFRKWLYHLIEGPQEITLWGECLEERQRVRQQYRMDEGYPVQPPSLDPGYLASASAQRLSAGSAR